MRPARSLFIPPVLLAAALLASACDSGPTPTHLASLSDVSIEALRSRSYHSVISLESMPQPSSFLASYDSDGNRIYTRIDVPDSAPPAAGYPVLIFVHGWIGRDAAPGYDFSYGAESLSNRVIEDYRDAGFLVLSPALRGHGEVNGVAAEGIEFLEAWDNGSYISPMFYAIDVLNLLEGLETLESADWSGWGLDHGVRFDAGRINISGHSQGGDAALTALAVSGEGSSIKNTLAAGSIWSGCFGPRFEQAGIYGPMATTLEAFMSGDGSWTGTAVAADGSVNPNFVFGYPSDWIGTVDTRSPEWTWQAETWATPTVADALRRKFTEMYDAVNRQVEDIPDARFEITEDENGKAIVNHDPRISEAMRHIGAFDYDQYLSETVYFHHSDRDYYSIPRWNSDLATRINRAGGKAADFIYPGTNHSLRVSEYDWFSEGKVIDGLEQMIERDQALFLGQNTPAVETEAENGVSITALRRYASLAGVKFIPEFGREPLGDVSRTVVSFSADGLRQYALALRPAGEVFFLPGQRPPVHRRRAAAGH